MTESVRKHPLWRWSERRLKLLSTTALLSIGIVLGVSAIRDPATAPLLHMGDFPAFYAAGKIIRDGYGARLYEPSLQAQIQNEIWPELRGEYYAFAYPPYVATLFAPFTLLPPATAKFLYIALLAIAFFCSVVAAGRFLPLLQQRKMVATAYGATFAPMFSGIIAGQNTSVSMLLYSLLSWGLVVGGRAGDRLAGISAGLWMFKPHFALIALGLTLAIRRSSTIFFWWMTATFSLVLIALLSVGAVGFTSWLTAVTGFAAADYAANSHQMVSLAGAFYAAGIELGFSASTIELMKYAGLALSLLLIAQAMRALIHCKANQENSSTDSSVRWPVLFGLAAIGPIVCLTAPHTLYYDLGLTLLPIAILLSFWSEQGFGLNRITNIAILASLLVGALVLARPALPVQPLILLPLYLIIKFHRKLLSD